MDRLGDDEIAWSTDVDALWSTLQDAMRAGDEATLARVRSRMAELSERPFAHLADEELHARIDALRRRAQPEPINVWTGWTEGDTSRPALQELNRHVLAARDTRHDGTLAQLLAELRHRGAAPDA